MVTVATPGNVQGLEYGLLLPRDPLRLKIVSGSVEYLNSNTNLKVPPVAITYGDFDDFQGLKSGSRSALFELGNEKLKIEGCDIEAAILLGHLYKERYVRVSDGKTSKTPRGGYILPIAQLKAENTLELNERFTDAGFPVPYEPIAIIHYGVNFKPSSARSSIREFVLGGPSLKGAEDLGAVVMKFKGDTRMAELYRLFQ